MNWKETESFFLELRDCFLICDELIAPMSSQRALILRKEVGRLTRKLSEVLDRGEREWWLRGEHYDGILMDETVVSHVDSVEQRDQRELKLIPEDHMRKVCRPGQGAKTCCLLVMGRLGFECTIGTNLELILRQRAFKGEMHARSVNCNGPPSMGEVPNAIPKVGQERPAQEGRDVEGQATLRERGQGQGGHPSPAGEGAQPGVETEEGVDKG